MDFFSVLLNIVRLDNLRGIANASERDMIFELRRLHEIWLTTSKHALKLPLLVLVPLLEIFLFLQLVIIDRSRILVRMMDV